MNEINPQTLLSQIRTMHAELQAGPATAASEAPAGGFNTLFANALNQVNETQMQAAGMKREFEIGGTDRSLAEVMIASQKADLSFRAMSEVRNKLVNAYQEIMNMPV